MNQLRFGPNCEWKFRNNIEVLTLALVNIECEGQKLEVTILCTILYSSGTNYDIRQGMFLVHKHILHLLLFALNREDNSLTPTKCGGHFPTLSQCYLLQIATKVTTPNICISISPSPFPHLSAALHAHTSFLSFIIYVILFIFHKQICRDLMASRRDVVWIWHSCIPAFSWNEAGCAQFIMKNARATDFLFSFSPSLVWVSVLRMHHIYMVCIVRCPSASPMNSLLLLNIFSFSRQRCSFSFFVAWFSLSAIFVFLSLADTASVDSSRFCRRQNNSIARRIIFGIERQTRRHRARIATSLGTQWPIQGRERAYIVQVCLCSRLLTITKFVCAM